ncbi:hypothetical protein SAMN03080598_00477 [Algoriphagus boritolerans DSM 17298 = JCM 18970]|uniref:Uncharacterized protein n=1 Tax=Algoriphagus boritolerans DSM 17298 = JCM 18970 TaxID=1120964 RepID=A0A1H5SRB7_9BACT|nr:hypothetical protein SAMN03080598_00477 [Algoriphagus boritolerans DSM 17298 = JCM 18970]
MLIAIQVLTVGLAILSLLSMILGLVKPVLVLWFLDRFNRLTVLQIYGTAFLISLGFLIILKLIASF